MKSLKKILNLLYSIELCSSVMYYHMEIPLWFERRENAFFVRLPGWMFLRTTSSMSSLQVCLRFTSKAQWLAHCSFGSLCFVLLCFFFSLSLSLSIFRLIFRIYLFFFFDTSSRDTFLFFLNKPSIIELYENSNSLEFNIIAYHNFMRFIIFTIELSIVNLILSKQIYVLT